MGVLGPWVLVLLVGCGSGREREFVDSDTPREDRAVPRPDSSTSSDSAAPIGDAAPTACVPTTGAEALSGRCQQVMISVLARDGLPSAVEARGIMTSIGDGCAAVDRVELIDGDETIQVLSGVGASMTESFVARADTATPALTALCGSADGRYDPLQVVIHGRTDGGTFTARCGASADGGFGWPPSAVVTCHRNLPVGPAFWGSAETQVSSGFTWSSISVGYPNEEGIVIDAIDGDVEIIPTNAPFGAGGFFEPFGSTGWDTSISFFTSERRFISVQLDRLDDAFGAEMCPVGWSGVGEPPPDPPVLMMRLTGTGAAGRFESEAYLNGCYRSESMPPPPTP